MTRIKVPIQTPANGHVATKDARGGGRSHHFLAVADCSSLAAACDMHHWLPIPAPRPGRRRHRGEAAAFKFGVPRAGAPELGPAGSTGHALGFGDSQQRAGQVR